MKKGKTYQEAQEVIRTLEENRFYTIKYHCGTAANFYSKVHWAWFPKGYKGREGYRSKRVGEYILKHNCPTVK